MEVHTILDIFIVVRTGLVDGFRETLSMILVEVTFVFWYHVGCNFTRLIATAQMSSRPCSRHMCHLDTLVTPVNIPSSH